MVNDVKDSKLKFSILSISLLAMAAPAVATTIPAIMTEVPKQSASGVGLLMSVPSLAILLTIFFSPLVTKLIGTRKTVLLGLGISLFSGITPFFTDDFMIMLVSRFALGIGIGLFNSLAYSLIMINFSGEERDKMLGFQGAFSSIGSMLGSLSVGWLLQFNWHVSYLFYLIAVIPLVAFTLFGPRDNAVSQVNETDKNSEKVIVNKFVLIYAIELFVIYATWMIVIFQLATLYVEKNIGTPSQASFALAINTLAGFLASLVYGKIRNKLGEYIGGVSILLGGLGIIGLNYATNFITNVLLIIFIGIFFSFINPYVFGAVASISNKVSQNVASTILLVGINLGVFVNPYTIVIINKITGNMSISHAMFVSGFIILALGIVHTIIINLKRK